MTLLSIFIASIIGSPHCAGMCGGFAALSGHGSADISSVCSVGSYHLGRLSTYLVLGVLVGWLAEVSGIVSTFFGLFNLVPVLVSVLLIVSGLFLLLKRLLHVTYRGGGSVLTQYLAFPLKQTMLLSRVLPATNSFMAAKPLLLKYLLGLSSTLLPCGWLYTYLAVAATAGSVGSAALYMFVFWLGTLPVLLGVSFVGLTSSVGLQRIAPVLSPLLLVVGGLYSLYIQLLASGFQMHLQSACH